jgi:hypothetical protein
MEYMLLECPIRAPHPQMGRSDWTLLTTSVSPLVSSDMYVATGHVQEYSVGCTCVCNQLYLMLQIFQKSYSISEFQCNFKRAMYTVKPKKLTTLQDENLKKNSI